MKARLTLTPGTHAIRARRGGLRRRGDWFHDGADVPEFFFDRGIATVFFPWQTALAGWEFWKPWVGIEPDLLDWEVPALNLKEKFQPAEVDPAYWPRPSRVHGAAHSHGVNPWIIAAAQGLRINVLISVCSPVRCDVLDKYGEAARANIGYHLHYYAQGDRIQLAGGVGDGRLGVLRDFNYERDGKLIYKCDETIVLPERAGHSGLLHKPEFRDELLTAAQRILDRDGRDDLPLWLHDRRRNVVAPAGVYPGLIDPS